MAVDYSNLSEPHVLAAFLEAIKPICPGVDWPKETENPTFRHVYLGYSDKRKQWKIGVTSNLDRRAKRLAIRIEHSICLRDEIAGLVESVLHRHYGYLDRPHGHEWYSLDEDSIEEIKGLRTEKHIEYFCWVHGWRHIPKMGWVGLGMGEDYSRREILELARESRRFQRSYGEYIRQKSSA